MGKIEYLTKEQKIILDEIGSNDFLSSTFYLTGGTALSAFYLKHRYSDDLDFFSFNKFDNQVIFTLIEEWGNKYKFTFNSRFVEVVYNFVLVFKNRKTIKLDFAFYPYKQIESPKTIGGIKVDSLFDIAVNKLLVISQRDEIKDFVDLYYLLQKFSIWDLREAVKVKFKVEVESLLLASDFLKIEDFDYLPMMIKPLRLGVIKSFFRQQAKVLAGSSLE